MPSMSQRRSRWRKASRIRARAVRTTNTVRGPSCAGYAADSSRMRSTASTPTSSGPTRASAAPRSSGHTRPRSPSGAGRPSTSPDSFQLWRLSGPGTSAGENICSIAGGEANRTSVRCQPSRVAAQTIRCAAVTPCVSLVGIGLRGRVAGRLDHSPRGLRRPTRGASGACRWVARERLGRHPCPAVARA